MKTSIGFLLFFLFNASPLPAFSQGMSVDYRKVPPQTFMEMKGFMKDFGESVGELNSLKPKDSTADWEEIAQILRQMRATLAEMKRSDVQNSYKNFTDILREYQAQLQELGQKQDPAFFLSLDKLNQRCFKCHSTHLSGGRN